MARDRLAQGLARQSAPYRGYGPQSRGYERRVERQLLGRHLGEPQLPFGVDEQVLSMNAEAEQQRSVEIGVSPISTRSIGHSCTSPGSFAISADGTSSRIWWNAHRLNGACRQFARVT